MDSPKYFVSPYPFQDILLFHSANPESLSKFESAIPGITAQTSLQVNHEVPKLSASVRLLSSQAKSGIDLNGNKRLFLSGIGRLKTGFFYGEKNAECIRENALAFSPEHEILGLFTAFLFDKDSITIFNDFFGFGHLWYFDNNGSVFISNNYHLLLISMAAMGIKCRIDYGIAAAGLFSANVFFQQNFTDEMAVVGVKQLLMDSYIAIGPDGMKIIDYTPVINALHGKSSLDAQQLVDAGIEEIRENVHCVYKTTTMDGYVMDLSGGRDSRIMLAALLQNRNFFNKTKVRTRDTPKSRDLEIASGLLDLFGGDFLEEDSCPRFAYNEKEGIDIWRSYFMGQYHQLAAFGWSTRGKNKHLRLTGACGELYRNFWNNVHRKVISKSTNVEDLSRSLFEDSRIDIKSSRLFTESSINSIINIIEKMPGVDFRDKFEQQYLYFRTRHHFGFRGFQFFHEGPVWYPLMSPSLLTATWKAPFEERNNGMGIFYITEQLNPILPWVEYDGNFRLNTLSPSQSPIKDHLNKCLNITLNTDTNKWRDAHRKLCESIRLSRTHEDGRTPIDFDMWGSFLLGQTLEAIDDLKAHDSVFVELLSDEYINYLRNHCISSPRTFRQYCSKIISLRDQVHLMS